MAGLRHRLPPASVEGRTARPSRQRDGLLQRRPRAGPLGDGGPHDALQASSARAARNEGPTAAPGPRLHRPVPQHLVPSDSLPLGQSHAQRDVRVPAEGDGAEAVVPLEKNTQWLRAVAKQMARELGVSGSGSVAGGVGLGGVVNNYNQTINSPKALTRLEIYRQSKNLLSFNGGAY